MRTNVIHSLVFSKKLYSVEKAVTWTKENGFPEPTLLAHDSHMDVVVLSLLPRSELAKSAQQIVLLDKGVSALGCPVSSAVEKSFAYNMEQISDDALSTAEKQNKESFNGTAYVRAAPGGRREVTQPNGIGSESVEKAEISERVEFAKADASKRIVIGAVYIPMAKDAHGDFATAQEIEKAAYRFMEEQKNYSIDKQHNKAPSYGYVVESYIAKSGDPLFVEGSWVMGVKVTCDKTWKGIESGEITGFSFGGSAVLTEISPKAS